MARRRPSISPNVGIFVGISTFHIGLSFWKISNFNKVAAPAPATECVSMGYFRGCDPLLPSVGRASIGLRDRKMALVRRPSGSLSPPRIFNFRNFFRFKKL
jgi:hypothetical protein